MPRKPRLFVPGAIYHVYCRVARGEIGFDDPSEADEFVRAVKQIGCLHHWKVFAWCLMGNHYHFVVKTGSVPLWRTMQRLQGNVARKFNRRRRYSGRLWQSRYRARIIDSQDYFRQVVAYVHLNPVAAGIVDDPAEYSNSGHREIVCLCAPRLIDIPSVLIGLDEGISSGARDAYLAWIRTVAEAKWFAQGLRQLPWWKDARDINEIVEPDNHPEAVAFDGRALDDDRPGVPVGDFAVLFEESTGHSIAKLSSPSRVSNVTEARIELTLLAVARFALRSSDLAMLLNKHPSSLTRWLNEGLHRERNDSEFRDRINQLDAEISSAATTKR